MNAGVEPISAELQPVIKKVLDKARQTKASADLSGF